MKPESGQSCLSLTLLVLSCIVFVLVPALSANTVALPDADNAANSSFENQSGKAEKVFDFPADHVLHTPQAIVKNTELFAE
jgi:hypothetical protein